MIKKNIETLIGLTYGTLAGALGDKCIELSIEQIKNIYTNYENRHKSLTTRLYTALIESMKEVTSNRYEDNMDVLYDCANSLMTCWQREDVLSLVTFTDSALISKYSNNTIKAKDFEDILVRHIIKDEELEHVLSFHWNKKSYDNTKKIVQDINKQNVVLEEVRDNINNIKNKMIEDNPNKEVKKFYAEDTKAEFVRKWKDELFLHKGEGITLEHTFVMPDYKLYDEETLVYDNLKEHLKIFITKSEYRNMFIIGHPGMGKSSIVAFLINEYQKNNILIIKFRDLRDNELHNGLLNAIFYKLDEDLENKILIMDGYDELDYHGNKEDLLNNFQYDISKIRNLKWIITSRHNYISDTILMKEEAIYLQPFNNDKIKIFYNKLYDMYLEKEVKNIEVIGIPVILYMALFSEIDITDEKSIPEIYSTIFSIDRGIFRKLRSKNNNGFDSGVTHRVEIIGKIFLRILSELAFAMFEYGEFEISFSKYEDIINKNCIDNQHRELAFDFPLANLSEIYDKKVKFVHNSIYEFFVSEYIFSCLCELNKTYNINKYNILGEMLHKNKLSSEVIEFLSYRINNSNLCDDMIIFTKTIKFMLINGMLYNVNLNVKQALNSEKNIFYNLMGILHCYNLDVIDINCINYYLENKYVKELINDNEDIDLSYLDLSKTNLKYINLNYSNLNRANLCETNLSRANLCRVNLCESLLTEVDFHGSNLSKSNLFKANLERTNLFKVDLRGANMREADLRKAYLAKADLSGANLQETDLSEADLREADLRRADLRQADLREANLRKADLSGADLRKADLSGADLREVDLLNVNLNEVDLKNAILK